jgi:hypothetical protein
LDLPVGLLEGPCDLLASFLQSKRFKERSEVGERFKGRSWGVTISKSHVNITQRSPPKTVQKEGGGGWLRKVI